MSLLALAFFPVYERAFDAKEHFPFPVHLKNVQKTDHIHISLSPLICA